MGLLKIPGAAGFRIPEAGHDFAQSVDVRRALLTRECRDKDRCQVVDRNTVDADEWDGINALEVRNTCGRDDLNGPVIREASIEEGQLDIRCDFLVMDLVQEDRAIGAEVGIRIR